jgi:phosphoribosylanthranilate isomerase
MTLAKICGLSTGPTVDAALSGGASFLGFVFFAASPRRIDLGTAAHLAAPARGRAAIVAVTVDPDDALLERLARELSPDFIQLHGHETPSRVAEIRRRFAPGVIKALPVAEAGDLAAAREYQGVADHLMFDAKAPAGAARPGGLGAPFDWALLEGRSFDRPWFLAAGLDPWNVAEAVRLSGAPMVDVSSGVERGAGLKDPALIAAFLEAVRRA